MEWRPVNILSWARIAASLALMRAFVHPPYAIIYLIPILYITLSLLSLTLHYVQPRLQDNTQLQFCLLLADSIVLFLSLGFVGGAHNPYAILFILIPCFGAMILQTIGFIILTCLDLIFLSLIYGEFIWKAPMNHMSHQSHLHGMWIANSLVIAVGASWLFMLRKRKEKAEVSKKMSDSIVHRFEKMDSLGRIVATAAHTINTSLATLQLGLNELEDDQNPLSSLDKKRWVEDMRISIEHINMTIHKMLPEKSSAQNNEKSDFLDYLLASCHHWQQLRDCNLQIKKKDFQLAAPGYFLEEVRDVLFALLDNALDSYGQDKSKEIVVHVHKKDDELILAIEDFGSGMEPSVQERAMEPLYTTKPQGSGLGLYTVYCFAKKYSAHIDIQSKINKGSTVTVMFNTQYWK